MWRTSDSDGAHADADIWADVLLYDWCADVSGDKATSDEGAKPGESTRSSCSSGSSNKYGKFKINLFPNDPLDAQDKASQGSDDQDRVSQFSL